MYLLDTDVIIWILRSKQDIIEKISQIKEQSPVCISVMSIAEIYKNIFPTELVATEEFLNQHIIYNINSKVAKIAGLYWQQYNKQLKGLSISDCLIAGTANINDLTVVTLNKKHFPMNDIKILDPSN